jgi:hypothetical protein
MLFDQKINDRVLNGVEAMPFDQRINDREFNGVKALYEKTVPTFLLIILENLHSSSN